MKKIPQDKKSQQYGQWVVMMEKKAMAIARQPQKETNTSIHSILVIAYHLKVSLLILSFSIFFFLQFIQT